MCLLRWPKLVLLSRPSKGEQLRGKDRQRAVSDNIRLAREGQWRTLWQAAMDGASLHHFAPPVVDENENELPEDAAEHFLKRIQKGSPLSTWKQIHGAGLANLSEVTVEQAKAKLRPTGATTTGVERHAGDMTWCLTPEQFDRAHLKLLPHKSLDPLGWSHESWTFLARSTCLRIPICNWLQRTMLLMGDHPLMTLLSIHRMVLLAKKDGGVRPILLSTIPRKVVHLGVCTLLRADLGNDFQKVQFGVGTPQGAAMLMARLASVQQETECPAFARLDISNAFGHLSRVRLLELLRRRSVNFHASWGPWITEMLASHILVATHMPAAPSFMVAEGLAQGDPLSAFLFAYFIAEVLLDAQSELQEGLTICAYIDDVIVAGECQLVELALPQIFHHLECACLPPNPTKTQVWMPSEPLGLDLPLLSSMQTSESGIMICGHALSANPDEDLLPLGSPEFVDAWCVHRVAEEKKMCARLLSLVRVKKGPYGLQTAVMLFRMLWPARINHMLRALPVFFLFSLVEPMHDLLLATFCSLLGVEHLSASQFDVACLPRKMGGLGFCDLRVSSLITRLSAIATLICMDNVPPIVATWHAQERPVLVSRLQPHVTEDLSATLASLDPLPGPGQPRGLARRLTRSVSLCLSDALRAGLQERNPGLAWKWRRHAGGLGPSAQQFLCSAWMDALPSEPGAAMEDECYRWCLRQRVGLDDHLPGAECQSATALTGCPCGKRLDMWGRHAMLCNAGEITRTT